MKQNEASCFEFDRKSWKLRQHDLNFSMEDEKSLCRTNTSVSKDSNKSKRAGLLES